MANSQTCFVVKQGEREALCAHLFPPHPPANQADTHLHISQTSQGSHHTFRVGFLRNQS